MQETPIERPAHDPARSWLDPGHQNAKLIYILYFLSMVVGVTLIVGVVMAYMNRGKAGGYVESHYEWLIRTFWIGLLYVLAGMILSLLVIGFLILVLVVIWFIIRLVKGLQLLAREEAIADTQSWLF